MLVLDLDQTIVHTPSSEQQHNLARYAEDGRVFDISHHDMTLDKALCAPRSHILEFFAAIRNKFHVMYCTAGTPSYGVAVVKGLRKFLLDGARQQQGGLDSGLQHWIEVCTDHRCVLFHDLQACCHSSCQHMLVVLIRLSQCLVMPRPKAIKLMNTSIAAKQSHAIQ